MCVLVASPRVMGESVRAWRKRKGEGIRQACLQPNLLLNIELDLQIYIGFDPIFTRDSNERETDLPGNELGNGASAKNPRVCALFCLIPVRFRLSVLIFFFFFPTTITTISSSPARYILFPFHTSRLHAPSLRYTPALRARISCAT